MNEGLYHTKPYPLELPVTLSIITLDSTISPKDEKAAPRDWKVVVGLSPPWKLVSRQN